MGSISVGSSTHSIRFEFLSVVISREILSNLSWERLLPGIHIFILASLGATQRSISNRSPTLISPASPWITSARQKFKPYTSVTRTLTTGSSSFVLIFLSSQFFLIPAARPAWKVIPLTPTLTTAAAIPTSFPGLEPNNGLFLNFASRIGSFSFTLCLIPSLSINAFTLSKIFPTGSSCGTLLIILISAQVNRP